MLALSGHLFWAGPGSCLSRTRDSLSHSVGPSVSPLVRQSVRHAVRKHTERRFNLRYCPCPATYAVVYMALFLVKLTVKKPEIINLYSRR